MSTKTTSKNNAKTNPGHSKSPVNGIKGKKPPEKNQVNNKNVNVYSPQNDPLEEMKKKIKIILQESHDKITSISMQCSQLDIDSETSYAKAQEEYAKDLDDAYITKVEKIRSINDKYAYDLFKLKEYYDINDSYNVNTIIYQEVMKDKMAEIKEVEEDFSLRKKGAKEKYEEKIKKTKQKSMNQRKALYESGMFEEIKQKINDILQEPILDEEHKQEK